MDADDIRAQKVAIPFKRRIYLTWIMWHDLGVMPLKTAIRTFFFN